MISNIESKIETSSSVRRRWSPADKRSIVIETYQEGVSVSQIARKYGIVPSQLFNWRRLMEEGGMKGIRSKGEVVSKREYKELLRKLKQTERAQ